MASMLNSIFGDPNEPAASNNNLVAPQNNRYGSSHQWLADISSRQQSYVTPEIRNRIQEKGRRQKVRARKKKRAKVYQKAAEVNSRAWVQGNRRVLSSAPQFVEESAQLSRNQMKSIQSVYRCRNVAYEDDAFEEEEERLETLVTSMEVAQLTDDVEVEEGEMVRILNQLKREPKVESEVKAKFGLFEDYLATVEDSRNATHDFWKECKPDFEAAVDNSEHVIEHIEKQIKNIDSEDNLGIVWNAHRWFVYDMTVKADQNNQKLKACLHDLEIKLELLDKDDECPFCLEAGRNSVTLGCCHKACEECWTHWQELKGANAFCPLCRQEDFLENMAEAGN